jgi:PiT family inorganic phosphate transporter
VTFFLLVALALLYTFVNGFQGSSSSVATIIASRALDPRLALGMSAVSVFLGPFVFGIAVATTIGPGIVEADVISTGMIIAALASAVAWSLLTWFLGIPSSPSHALVGGLVGAVIARAGAAAVQPAGITKVGLALFLSPMLGMLFGILVMRLVLFLTRHATIRVNWWFRNGQMVTGIALALSNGANDAPKGMGVLALGLVAAGALPDFQVPLWVIISCAGAMALGTLLGGWRVIRTLGGKFFRIRPVDSFCSQVAAASVITAAALFGGPVSTTQVVSASILGVGAAVRINKVRWGVAQSIAMTWLLTIPANIGLAYGLYKTVGRLL